jgi:hypothetical protein
VHAAGDSVHWNNLLCGNSYVVHKIGSLTSVRCRRAIK